MANYFSEKYKRSFMNKSGIKAIKHLWDVFCSYHKDGLESDERFALLCEPEIGRGIMNDLYAMCSQKADVMQKVGWDEDQMKVMKDFAIKYEVTENKDDLIPEAVEMATNIFTIE